jgi:hypothetical protein
LEAAQHRVVCPEKSSFAGWWKSSPGEGQAARQQATGVAR